MAEHMTRDEAITVIKAQAQTEVLTHGKLLRAAEALHGDDEHGRSADGLEEAISGYRETDGREERDIKRQYREDIYLYVDAIAEF